jgi:hypothetical protein
MIPKLPLDSAVDGQASDAAQVLLPRQLAASKLGHHLRVCQMRFASVGADTQQAGELREPAKVCVLKAFEKDQTPDLANRVAMLLDDEWLVDELFGKPTVAILVTGGAQDFKMLPRVKRVFREGLVKAAQVRRGRWDGTNACAFLLVPIGPPTRATRSTDRARRTRARATRTLSLAPRSAPRVQMTNAWVFTGGMASGVMKHVGEALANFPDIPCIGMPLAGNVVGHEVGVRASQPPSPPRTGLVRAEAMWADVWLSRAMRTSSPARDRARRVDVEQQFALPRVYFGCDAPLLPPVLVWCAITRLSNSRLPRPLRFSRARHIHHAPSDHPPTLLPSRR